LRRRLIGPALEKRMVVAREGSRPPRRAARPWRTRLVALALAPAAIALLGAAGPAVPAADVTPDPAASASPTPTPTPTPRRATLKVVKTDQSGTTITTPGARFNVHRGAADGPVVAALTTDGSGTASADTLVSGTTYCLEETAAPAGFRAEPAYTPGACATLVAGTASVISVADPPAGTPAPTPTATPAPTPTPTPVQTGELLVTKHDSADQVITTPGFTFNVHVGSATGQVIATISTDGSGTAIAGALNPATYCVEETTAPDGYQVAPTYSPSACVAVASDPSQGHSPTIVTVSDPATATPSPSAAAAPGVPPASPRAPGRTAITTPTAAGVPVATLARALVVLGVLLLGAGGVLVAVSIRRRRLRAMELPPDTWYDSTIT
jgi:uncharacterized surface anchored protein